MLIRTMVAAGFLLSASASAADRGDREKLLGTWQVDQGATHETWTLESDGDNLRVAKLDDGKVTLDLKCRPDGSECTGTDEGHKVKVTMYFNGSALIQMETKDSHVTTRKFTLDGLDRMTIDVNPLTGPGKQYTLQLTRHLQAAVRH